MFDRTLSRRDAVRLLGLGTGLGVLTTVEERVDAANAWLRSSAQSPASTRAIVRTILKDVTPDSITGATLIHEHLSFGSDAPGELLQKRRSHRRRGQGVRG